MGKIETVYTWRCSHCGRIFHDSDKQKLEEFKTIHERACGTGTGKWEYKGPPPKTYYGI